MNPQALDEVHCPALYSLTPAVYTIETIDGQQRPMRGFPRFDYDSGQCKHCKLHSEPGQSECALAMQATIWAWEQRWTKWKEMM